jgi:HEAT repeat protein
MRPGLLARALLCAALSLPYAPAASAYQWSGKIAFAAKGLDDSDPSVRLAAVRKLAEFDPVAARKYLLPVLGDHDVGVRREAARVLARGKVVEAIEPISEWLQSYDKDERVVAAGLLGDLASPRAVAALGRALADTEPDVRKAAVEALGRIGGPDVITPLVGRLDDDSMQVRRSAAERLRDLGDARAIIPLVERFSDAAKEVRLAAVQGVGRLGDPRATSALIRLLRDPVLEVRLAAVEALGLLRSPEAVDALLPLLESRSDEIGTKVCEALGRIGDVRSVRALVRHLGQGPLRAASAEALVLVGKPAVPQVVACLEGSADECDPAAAVPLLGQIGDSRATPALIVELGRARVKKDVVVDALGQIADPTALVPLLALLDGADAALEKRVLRVIEPILDARAGDVLVRALADKDEDVRVLAATYLGGLGVHAAVPPLLALTGKETPSLLRLQAIRSLGLIGDARATLPLVELLAQGDADARVEAADALAYLKDPASVAPLLRIAEDPASPARRPAIAALRGPLRATRNAKLRAPARATLEKLLGGNDVALALDALDTLAAMNDAESLAAILPLARQGRRDLRRSAIGVLGNFRDARALPVLVDALADEDDGIRGAAAWALGKLGDAQAVPALLKAAHDRGFVTQVNASGALARLGPAVAAKLGDEPLTLAAHRNPWVRANAAVLLGLQGGDAAQRRLVEMATTDSHRYVRWAAVRGLVRLGTSKDVLAKIASQDESKDIQETAREARPPAKDAPRDEWVHVYWNDADGAPLRQELFVLVGADSVGKAGYTDQRGEAGEEGFPRGPWNQECLGAPGEDAYTALDLCEAPRL